MSSRFLAIIIWWPGKHAPAVINPSRASSGVCHLSLLIFPLDASWVPVPAGSQTGHETRVGPALFLRSCAATALGRKRPS